MTELTEAEKAYLDDKFERFKLSFWKKFKVPAIGLAVVFAGLVAIFATYLYMEARLNVLAAQEELAEAKITFYSDMSNAHKDITALIEKFNLAAEKAEISVTNMKVYEEELEKIAEKHKKLRKIGHPNGVPKIEEEAPPMSELPLPSRNMFKIGPTTQQLQEK